MAALTVTNSVLSDMGKVRRVGFAATQFRENGFFVHVQKISVRQQ